MSFNNSIQLVCLPFLASNTYPGTNAFVYAAGWGTLSYGGVTPDNLNNVKLTTYDASKCNYSGTLNTGQICAGLIIFILLKAFITLLLRL